MMPNRVTNVFLATAVACVTYAAAACAPAGTTTPNSGASAGVAGVDAVRLMRTIGVLAHDSMEGRATGTAGGQKARRFLVSELERRGVKPFSASGYTQEFRLAGRQGADSVTGANIVGVIRGTRTPDRYIVVS